MLRCWFYLMFGFYVLFGFVLHRLVGLRLLRLCLKLRQGFALYPQWVSPLDPDQGRVPGPFARFARCFILLYACNLLWSAMLIPHSSLLIPHSSFLIYPCSICHTPLLSSPISPPKYHQAYQSFPISTSNLLPLLTVYSFWLYRQGKVYPAFVR